MAKTDRILAVDIGADSLKIAEFCYPQGGGIVLEKFAFSEYGGNLKEEELLDSLSDVFKTTLEENGFTANKVHLSISGQSAFIRFVKLPPLGDDEESKVSKMVEYEARQNVPFPMNEVVWDYQLISSADDSTEIEVVFVVVKNDLIENITKIIDSFGKETLLVEVAPTSCFNSARANDIGEEECIMILNIGGRCSTLVFIDGGRFFERSIPIAGHSVTQQISKEFGIPFADAEEMKRRHGFVALGGAYEEPDSEVAATVSKIVRNVMTRLHGEINRSINVYRSQQKGNKPVKLFLAGGSSVMAFTPRFFSEKLRVPVEYFNPFHVVSLSDSIDREELAEVAHMFSEVIGLGLRHATVCPIEISLVPDAVKKQHELKSKIPYFYFSALSFILCLGVTLLGFWKQSIIDKNRAEKAKQRMEITKQTGNNVRLASQKLKSVESKYNKAKQILKDRTQWTNLLNEIQKALPDRMWLTYISECGAPTQAEPEEDEPGVRRPIFGTLFGSRKKKKAAKAETRKIEWIELKGHSLCEKHKSKYIYEFTTRIAESPLFVKQTYEPDFTPGRGKNNITKFNLKVKLKEPITH